MSSSTTSQSVASRPDRASISCDYPWWQGGEPGAGFNLVDDDLARAASQAARAEPGRRVAGLLDHTNISAQFMRKAPELVDRFCSCAAAVDRIKREWEVREQAVKLEAASSWSLEASGAFVRLRAGVGDSEVTPHLRGAIREWTRGSIMRARDYLNGLELPSGGAWYLLTFTFPFDPGGDGLRVRQWFHVLLQALYRGLPVLGGVWKREFQLNGRPHYHVWVYQSPESWGVCDMESEWDLREWLQATWGRILGYSGDMSHAAMLKPWGISDSPARYFGSYLRKAGQAGGECADGQDHKAAQNVLPEGYENPGRWWGHFGWHFRLRPLVVENIPDVVGYKVRRVLRRLREHVNRRKCTWSSVRRGVSCGIYARSGGRDVRGVVRYLGILLRDYESACLSDAAVLDSASRGECPF